MGRPLKFIIPVLIAVAVIAGAVFFILKPPLKPILPQMPAAKNVIPEFVAEHKLEYTYIIDGNKYADRLITKNKTRAFDLFRLAELVGVSVFRGNNDVAALGLSPSQIREEKSFRLSYLGSDAILMEEKPNFFGVYVKGKKIDAGITPYKIDDTIYVDEKQIIGLLQSPKLPFRVTVDENTKTVTAANPFFGVESNEPVCYFDIAANENMEVLLSYYEENIILEVQKTGERYQKEVGSGFIDGRVIFPEIPDSKADLTVYLWDGAEVKTIPLKLG
jgi:hypothetical protein